MGNNTENPHKLPHYGPWMVGRENRYIAGSEEHLVQHSRLRRATITT